MNSTLTIVQLQQHHIEEAADVLTRSFLQLNTIWKVYSPKYQQIFPIMRAKIYPSLGKGWSFVLVENKKVIGVCLQYDMLDYINVPSIPTDLKLFAALSEAGKQLESQLDLTGLKRGDVVYGLYGVIDPDHSKKGYSLSFWWQCFAMGKISGWKYYYSRISSPVSLKMLKLLGAEVMAESSVKTEEGEEKVWMIRIDLANPLPSMSMLAAIGKRKGRPEEASL